MLDLDPVCDGSDTDHREERGCCFFVSDSDSAPLLDASPEVFNEMLAMISPLGQATDASRRFAGIASRAPMSLIRLRKHQKHNLCQLRPTWEQRGDVQA